LESERRRSRGQKGGRCQRRHAPDSKTTILDRKACLKPVVIAQIDIQYYRQTVSQCCINLRENWTVTHINGYPPAAGPVQASESSPVRDRGSTTELHRHIHSIRCSFSCLSNSCPSNFSLSFSCPAFSAPPLLHRLANVGRHRSTGQSLTALCCELCTHFLRRVGYSLLLGIYYSHHIIIHSTAIAMNLCNLCWDAADVYID